MSWNLVRLNEVPPQPWKNGGGTTRELLAWPSATDWRARVSVAQVVADGPFSRFDGVQRWFAVLGGAGVRLDVDGCTTTLNTASEPFAFGGAATTHCALLDGPTEDFNLMAHQARATLRRVRGHYAGAATVMNLIGAYAIHMRATARFGTETVELSPGTLAWQQVAGDGPVSLHGEDALWIEVTP